MSDRTLPGIHPPNKPTGFPAWVWFSIIGVAVVLLALTIGLSLSSGSSRPSPADDKYRQTWVKGYSDTTCAEWKVEMTASQQFAASADMLASARNKIDDGIGLPPDALIRDFQSGLTTACVIDDLKLSETAVLLYMSEPRYAP